MMWVYLGAAEFDRCVAICDRGLELAAQLGSAPVQYGSIKAIALARSGRFDEVEAALAQEVTDDDHPFGHAIARLARTEYLAAVGALEQAAGEGVAAFGEATMVSRRWMQQLAGRPAHVGACTARTSGAAGAVLLVGLPRRQPDPSLGGGSGRGRAGRRSPRRGPRHARAGAGQARRRGTDPRAARCPAPPRRGRARRRRRRRRRRRVPHRARRCAGPRLRDDRVAAARRAGTRRRGDGGRGDSHGAAIPGRSPSSACCATRITDPALRTAFEQDAPTGFDQAS